MIPPVVDFDHVRQLSEEVADRLVVADVRWYLDGRSGFDAYRAGHIPGAVFVDLERWLAGPASRGEGRHPLPDPLVFAEGMAALAVSDDSVVIGYDDAGGVTAARLVWMLRATGHDAALLDGGLQGYTGALVTGPWPTAEPTEPSEPSDSPTRSSPDGVPAAGFTPVGFTLVEWPPERLAGIEDALSPAHVVIDARAPERFRGDEEPIDPRPGHIPGARSLPCRDNLGADGRFLPADVLRARFVGARAEAAGARASNVVSYCGSGVTACHNLLALERAGLGLGRLYPGSWSQYSADPTRPAATGDE